MQAVGTGSATNASKQDTARKQLTVLVSDCKVFLWIEATSKCAAGGTCWLGSALTCSTALRQTAEVARHAAPGSKCCTLFLKPLQSAPAATDSQLACPDTN
jgi:hypothetical protein